MKAAAVASTNALFYPLLWVFHLFPLHAPITMWLLDAPFGRFSVASAFNLPGNVAWAAMELVAVSVMAAIKRRGRARRTCRL